MEVDSLKKASGTPYVVAVVLMTMIGIVAILILTLVRPDKDNSQLIATILSLIVPTTAAILALMKSQETHLMVNSQLAKWKLDFAALMRAEGGKEAVHEEQERIAAMKDKALIAAALHTPTMTTAATAPVPVVIQDTAKPIPVNQISK